jgi:hypothetical protein
MFVWRTRKVIGCCGNAGEISMNAQNKPATVLTPNFRLQIKRNIKYVACAGCRGIAAVSVTRLFDHHTHVPELSMYFILIICSGRFIGGNSSFLPEAFWMKLCPFPRRFESDSGDRVVKRHETTANPGPLNLTRKDSAYDSEMFCTVTVS